MQNSSLERSSRLLRRPSTWSGLACVGLLVAACQSAPPPTHDEAPTFGARGEALMGTDGDRTITAASTTVNQYTALSANAVQGATVLNVASVAALTSGADALAAGDLLLVIQMQGATLDTANVNSSTWGNVTALNGAGSFEFVEVASVNTGANTVTLGCALAYSYTTAGKAQVIRVPQYDTLTINAGASIVAPQWNGTTGGVVAVHAKTEVALDGVIDGDGLGFRGGAADNQSQAAGTSVTLYASADPLNGGQKGEGIGGFLTQYGRGPAGNGGGGGNSHNGGGGGGANGNAGGTWTGAGTFDDTVVGASAWSVDPAYTTTASPGGGRGGYTYSNSDLNALTVGPGDANWTGNNRRDHGGLGGHVLDADPASSVFLGGGGGAGDGNDNLGGAGGRGGGIVILLAGQVSGSGTIRANGANGSNATAANGTNGDAPGGGGAGGSLIVQALQVDTALVLEAKGGNGGSQAVNQGAETEGPGAGGGGGYIWVSGNPPAISVAGGSAGTTSSPALAEFPVNGATNGSAGLVTLAAANSEPVTYCIDYPDTTIATNPADPTSDPTGDFEFTSSDVGVTYVCTLDNVATSCSATFATAALADGSHTLTVAAQNTIGNVDPTPATYTWTVDTTGPVVSFTNTPPTLTSDATPSFEFTADEPGATFTCSIDGGAAVACTSPFTTLPLSDGEHTLDVLGADTVGNVSATPATFTFTVDTTAPDTTIETHPTDPSAVAEGTFTFSSNEANVTFECQIDAGPFVDCTTPDPFVTAALDEGSHTFSVRATDAAGTQDPTPATFTWEIETATVLPDTTIVQNPSDPSTSADASFEFGSTDVGASFECSLDGATFAACAAASTFTGLANGAHTILVRARNTDGVDPTPASYTWVINVAPPDDTDGDGVPDTQEVTDGTDPADDDSDDDGVLDGAEPSRTADTDGDGLINALDPDSDNDGIFDGTELGVTTPASGTDLDRGRFVPDADSNTQTDPLDPDSDGGGVSDGQEDPNHNGNIDANERDPNDAADDATAVADNDRDGLSNAEEATLGTDAQDADSDDDGVLDGAEPNPSDDTDGDGLINPLDSDSDNDGLTDGTELGLGCASAATDLAARHCVADADPTTTTSPLDPDTDGGGVTDGSEDSNRDGQQGAGETDPTLGHPGDDASVADTDGDGLSDPLEAELGSDPEDRDTDDDGVPDGLEPNPGVDQDGDGLPSVLDVDSDNDGLFDGTELGRDCQGEGTDAAAGHCRPDVDPLTTTAPLDPDTDHGGVRDGSEDANLDGNLDGSESDPARGAGADDVMLVDSDGDGLSDDLETFIGSEPNDADSDDDGLLDGDEPNPSDDFDVDGTIDVLDPDSDADGLFDGTEAGEGCANAATDTSKELCIADADPTSRTFLLDPDTDDGGVPDGQEDANHNGSVDGDDTDPLDGLDDLRAEGDAGLTEPGSGDAGGDAGSDGGPRTSGEPTGQTSDSAAPPSSSSSTASETGSPSSGGQDTTDGDDTIPDGDDTIPDGDDTIPDGIVILGGGLCSHTPASSQGARWGWLMLAFAVGLLRRRAK